MWHMDILVECVNAHRSPETFQDYFARALAAHSSAVTKWGLRLAFEHGQQSAFCTDRLAVMFLITI